MTQPEEPNYNCTQTELYAACAIGLSSYRENITQFTAFKARYDTPWADTFQAEITAAETLPNFQARDEVSETANILLTLKAKECTDKWQDLKRYILDAWPEILQKPKLEAAGSNLYPKAANQNWDILKSMLIQANQFIINYNTELTANQNMPPTFQTDFQTLKTDFQTLLTNFKDKEQDTKQQTHQKIAANNAIYKKLTLMFGDAQAIFRNNPVLKDRFIFTKVLELVRGSKNITKSFDIQNNNRLVINRLVANSEITNTGTVTLWLDSGDQPTQTTTALQLNPGDILPKPLNTNTITLFNPHPTTPGKATARITVD